ncbi:hypothetical protein FQR65_LT16459 [Abscondita terminalis]|nr:hypothetical protein FQR65_LT16459 [Abscondita terminalis]
MDSKIINGKEIAVKLNNQIKEQIIKGNFSRKPKLVVLQVGNNPASDIYVKNKKRSCENVGFLFEHIRFEETILEKQVLDKIHELNNDNTVDGFIVQLPLPKHINEKLIVSSISRSKDADGFTPSVLGGVMLNDTNIYPATPFGVKKLLDISNIDVVGKNVVIIGRITVCNTKTQNIKDITKNADILIVAAGVANMVDSS